MLTFYHATIVEADGQRRRHGGFDWRDVEIQRRRRRVGGFDWRDVEILGDHRRRRTCQGGKLCARRSRRMSSARVRSRRMSSARVRSRRPSSARVGSRRPSSARVRSRRPSSARVRSQSPVQVTVHSDRGICIIARNSIVIGAQTWPQTFGAQARRGTGAVGAVQSWETLPPPFASMALGIAISPTHRWAGVISFISIP